MLKRHGPSLRRTRIELAECPACRGRAVVRGVFYELACDRCNASGWVDAASGQALPLDELVTQLSLRLQAAQQQISALKRPGSGPAAQYEHNNRRGAGGSNYTGD